MPPERDWCAALQSLKEVKRLPDNWNGEETPGTDPEIWETANKLLFKLLGKVPPPFICPIPGGTLQFEWTVGEKHLEIEFVDKDTVYVLTEDATGTKPVLKTHEIPLSEQGRIMGYLAWLEGD